MRIVLKFFITFFLLIHGKLFAVEKYQLTFHLSPTFETINLRINGYNKKFKELNGEPLHGYKLSYNLGMEYKHFVSPGTSLSIGILYQNKGFRDLLDYGKYTSTGLFNQSVLIVSAHYLSIPTNLNLHFRLGNNSRWIMTMGITNGFLVKQVEEGKRIPKEESTIIRYSISGKEILDDQVKLNIFNNRFMGVNFGIGFVKYIRSKLVIEVQPMYCRQINKAIETDAPINLTPDPVILNEIKSTKTLFNPKFDSFSVDFKIGYYFNRQIQRNKKEF